MKRKFAMELLFSTLILLAGVGYCRSQEAPEPPEPPEAPEAAFGALNTQLFAMKGAARLGVTLKDVTAERVRDLKLPGEYGALVESVEADSAAAKAGLQKGDVIVEFSGERVRSVAQLRRLIRETPAGRTVACKSSGGGRLEPSAPSCNLERTGLMFRFRRSMSVPSIRGSLTFGVSTFHSMAGDPASESRETN